jgi:transposase InsO family protein
VRELEKRVRDLERMLSKKTMEVEILRGARSRRPQKASVAARLVRPGRFAVKTIANTLGVSRSNLVEQAKKVPLESPAKRKPYTKAEDVAVLPVIRRLIDQRSTYGYRRITALLNRERRAQDLPPVNAKRVLRIMQVNGLVLTRHTTCRPARTHDGVVIALRSNIRWCSDHLELKCRNGEIVRVLFVIDACDREIIAWSAVAHAGVSGEMVRDLMVEAVEQRFGDVMTPHPVEWLSDNGSAYIAVKRPLPQRLWACDWPSPPSAHRRATASLNRSSKH